MKKNIFLSILFFFSITSGCNNTAYLPQDSNDNSQGTEFLMSIDGTGFFVLRERQTEDRKYTKLGDFYLSLTDDVYYLVDSNGNYVQGWKTDINGDISGTIMDIEFPFESEPLASGEVTMILNLDRDVPGYSAILSSEWDGAAIPPISPSSYEYESALEVYDVEGTPHEITVYFDTIFGGDCAYIITCDPDEDLRAGLIGTEVSGLLAEGKISFNQWGGLKSMTMRRLERYTAAASGRDLAVEDTGTGTFGVIYSITVNRPEVLTSPGSSMMTLTYNEASFSWGCNGAAYPDAEILFSSEYQIEIDLDADTNADITIYDLTGVLNDGDTIDISLTGSADWETQNNIDISNNGYFEFQTDFIGGTGTTQDIAFNIGIRWNGTSFVLDSLNSSQYASSSTTLFQSVDGNGIEELENVTIEESGLITGNYSNGLDIPFFRISLAGFTAPFWLRDEGEYIYSETIDSGNAALFFPGTNGLGHIIPGEISGDLTFTDELFPNIGIEGQGFFIVRDHSSSNLYYTRSGEFYFNKEGCLTTPDGYIVQGWSTDPDGNITGSTTDIHRTSNMSQTAATEQITVITNLDSNATCDTSILSSVWDSLASMHISGINYEYQSTLKVYDNLGGTHDITIFYDKISGDEWEYIVTCNPDEDMRYGISGTEGAGLLARGKIVFNGESGVPTSITMSRMTDYTDTSAGIDQAVQVITAGGALDISDAVVIVNNPEILTNDIEAASNPLVLSFDGSKWSAGSGETIVNDTPTQVGVDLGGTAEADITVDLTQVAVNGDSVTLNIIGSNDWKALTIADINHNGYYEFQADFLGGGSTAQDISFDIGAAWNGTEFYPESLVTKQSLDASTTIYQTSDGYGTGAVISKTVDESGIIRFTYSNSITLKEWRIAVATFVNPDGLELYEGNIYEATSQSGSPVSGFACIDEVGCITISE